ncbi:TrkA family potassium uptake protein [Candidatus Dependentiae bacterium]|nr:TrkA family potassium uptake protein [Candidatus Dependentiae bacterium]
MKVCVIGIGRFGYHLASTLADNGIEVLAVDSNEAIVASIRDKVSQSICMRVSDEESLRSIGAEDMDVIVVAMGENFAQSILVTALLKHRLHVKNVITRSISEIHREILQLIGADQIVLPEREEGRRLADSLSLPFKALLRITPFFCIAQTHVPFSMYNKPLKKLNLLDNYGITVIGRKIAEEIEQIDPEDVLAENDILIVAGTVKNLTRFTKL